MVNKKSAGENFEDVTAPMTSPLPRMDDVEGWRELYRRENDSRRTLDIGGIIRRARAR